MTEATKQEFKDWAGTARGYAIAWGIPTLAIIFGSYFEAPVRALIWSVALGWMGAACLMNSKRCGRTHCRYTGPFYLILIAPIMALGFGLLPSGPYSWWIFGAIVLFGGKIIWFATERTWGKYDS